MGITFKPDPADVVICSDEQRLAQIDAALVSLYTSLTTVTTGTAQEYSIDGSRMVKNVALDHIRSSIADLEIQKRRYEKKVLRAKGFTGRNNADFSGQRRGRSSGDVD